MSCAVIMLSPEILFRQTAVAAATAKLLQSCPTLCSPLDGSPPGSSTHGIFQARVLEWSAVAFSVRQTREEQLYSDKTSLWSGERNILLPFLVILSDLGTKQM